LAAGAFLAATLAAGAFFGGAFFAGAFFAGALAAGTFFAGAFAVGAFFAVFLGDVGVPFVPPRADVVEGAAEDRLATTLRAAWAALPASDRVVLRAMGTFQGAAGEVLPDR
jgi:hypothetical protein